MSNFYHSHLDDNAPTEGSYLPLSLSSDQYTPPGTSMGHTQAVLPEDTLEPNYAVFVITLLIVIIAGIGNVVVIVAFSATSKLRNPTGLCMISLATVDVFVVVFYMSVSLPCSLHGDCLIMSNREMCLSAVAVSYTSYGAGFLTLNAVSINRAVLISYPLKYRTIFTTKATVLTLAAIWICSLGITLGFICSRPYIIQFNPGYYNCGLAADQKDAWPYSYVISILGFFIPVLMMTVCSWKIVSVLRQARRRVRAANATSMRGSLRRSSPQGTQSDRKVTMRLFLVVIPFVISFLPYQIQLIYARNTGKMYPSTAALIAVMLPWIVSAVNPVMIAFTYSNFRNVLRDKLARFCLVRHRTNVPHSRDHAGGGHDYEDTHDKQEPVA